MYTQGWRAQWRPYRLDFNFEARTSRAVMRHKDTYFVKLWHESDPARFVIAECPLFKGLSAEDTPDFEDRLTAVCANPTADALLHAPSSIRFAFESATNSSFLTPHSSFKINGLVWMGDRPTMLARIRQKLDDGFRCIKLKIGGIDFDDELSLLAYIRRHYGPDSLELRLDANGAFDASNVMQRLDRLAAYHIHSIEQPVRAGQPELMARVCHDSPIDVALDEELIGITPNVAKQALISFIKPRYIILKPALCGGFSEADAWIAVARHNGVGWWATSALESNVGLAAIGRWLAKYDITMPQGLGTGQLYTNNVGGGVTLHGSTITVDNQYDTRQLNYLFE